MTLHAYKAVKRASMIEGTSPHQLIEMLYDGALSQIAISRQHLGNNNRQLLHDSVDKTVAIVQELQASLRDYDTNELAGNLFELYTFIVSTLINAEKSLDDNEFSVCADIISTLRAAWREISPGRIAAA